MSLARRRAGAALVKHEVENSLKRLQTDVIDLIQVHWPDPATPIGETMEALVDLRRAGKVRAIGVSNYSIPMLKEAQAALGPVPLASDQPKYSLVARDIEKDLLPHCADSGIGVIVYSPLEQGLLTGRVTATRSFAANDGRSKRPTFTAGNRALVNGVLERVVRPIAERHGATIGQIVIAWTVASRGVTAAIVGARTPEQAIENAQAGDIVLAPAELAEIRAAFEALKLESPAPLGLAAGLKQLAKRLLGR